jgi:hypothetical protein
MSAVDDDHVDERTQRFELFKHISSIERELDVTFFVMVLCPDMYIYHKKDSIEFRKALGGQSVAAVAPGTREMPKLAKPESITTNFYTKYHYRWWLRLTKRLNQLSATYGWHWFVVAIQNTTMLFSAQTANFPIDETRRHALLESIRIVWEESQLADVEYAKDMFVRHALDVARYAANDTFVERRGIRLI